jgi:membrane fusion protein (multidrug efflux system)
MTTKRKIWTAVIVGLIISVAGLGGVKALQIGTMIKAGKSFAPPPEAVTTAQAEATQWQASHPAIGSLVAIHSVVIGSELPGTVREIFFDSGGVARSGAVLVKLDTSVEEAQLAAAVADATLARQGLDRARRLRKSDYTTAADIDAQESRFKQAEAAVAALRATIAKKTIRAPFDGRLGIRQVELGQVLSPGTPLVSLQSIDPIYAEFYLPQQTLSDLHRGMPTRLSTDAFPGKDWQGEISTVNPEVDLATRNVRVRATFANPGALLLPGMFANVEVLSPDKRPVLIIPATAIIYAPYGDSVFTVVEKKEGNKPALVAQQKFVRLGDRRGDLVAVETGLIAGETVVSAGAFKLRNGVAVVVKNDLAPDVQVNPHPTDR